MRSRTGAADGDPLAPKILRFLDWWPRVEPKVELLMKIGDADEVRAAETSVDEVSRANNRRVNLPGAQRSDGQRIQRHQNKLHVESMLFEQATLARHPHGGHAFAGDAGRQVCLDLRVQA